MNFKCYDNKNKRWVESFYIDKEGNIYEHKSWDSNLRLSYKLIEATICRGTGLFDINKKEIFEFDITTNKFGDIYTVEWDLENSRFVLYNDKRHYYMIYLQPECKIIGNIFDTPYLLEEKLNSNNGLKESGDK